MSSPAYVVKSLYADRMTNDVRRLVREIAPEAPVYREFTMEFLAQRSSTRQFLGVKGDDLLDGQSEAQGDGLEFGVVDPDEAGLAGATIAAASAGEAETAIVPGSGHRGDNSRIGDGE